MRGAGQQPFELQDVSGSLVARRQKGAAAVFDIGDRPLSPTALPGATCVITNRYCYQLESSTR
jgi:hypothetical protein